MTVKDVFEEVGMPATSGDPAFKDYVPKRNAIAVQRLIDAGDCFWQNQYPLSRRGCPDQTQYLSELKSKSKNTSLK
jgi:hypothetical protein